MKYPALSSRKVRSIADELLSGSAVDVDGMVVWRGEGDLLDLQALNVVVQQANQEMVALVGSDRDSVEGRLAGPLFECLQESQIEILDDPGFWAYLSVSKFWEFVVWRERNAFASKDYLKYGKYVDGRNWSECVLHRTYLRGRLATVDGDSSLAAAVEKGTDLWRSHILRVRTSTAPGLARAVVKEQAADRMDTKVLRSYAKRINRMWTNVDLELWNDEDLEALVNGLRDV